MIEFFRTIKTIPNESEFDSHRFISQDFGGNKGPTSKEQNNNKNPVSGIS